MLDCPTTALCFVVQSWEGPLMQWRDRREWSSEALARQYMNERNKGYQRWRLVLRVQATLHEGDHYGMTQEENDTLYAVNEEAAQRRRDAMEGF